MSTTIAPAPTTLAIDPIPTITPMPRIGDKAPDFTAPTTHGELTFSEWQDGKWIVLFSHPADFTPVCSTELAELARRNAEFTERETKLMGLSIDSIHSHLAWRESLKDIFNVDIPFPIIADLPGTVARKYGMLHPGESATVTVRTVFFIDPNRTIRAIIYYPLNIGRNIDELVRVIDALQTADGHGVACPANWKPGDKVIVPPPKTVKDAEERKSGNYEGKAFYLKYKSIQ